MNKVVKGGGHQHILQVEWKCINMDGWKMDKGVNHCRNGRHRKFCDVSERAEGREIIFLKQNLLKEKRHLHGMCNHWFILQMNASEM